MLGAAWQSVAVRSVVSRDRSVHQTAHAMMRRELREGLLDAGGWPGSGGFGSVAYRASVALYAFLLEHSVDRRGCCWSCRRPGAVLGRRRRRCRVCSVAKYWLHQPQAVLLESSLAIELGLGASPPPIAGPGGTGPCHGPRSGTEGAR